MDCNNSFCTWCAFGQCCPEDEESLLNARPNALDCPSSLRIDFQEQLMKLVSECERVLRHRNMRELIQVKKFIESQRSTKNRR